MSDHFLGQRPGRPAARARAPFVVGAWPAMALAALHAERERWALWLPVGLGVGVGAYFALPVEPAPWIGPTCLGLALLLIAVTRGRDGISFGLAIVVAVMALGFIAADLRTDWAAAPVLAKKTAAITITGRVVAVEPRVVGVRLLLDRLEAPAIDGPVPRRARITVRAKGVPPAPGDRVRLRAVLMPPPEPAAPDAYDFARTLYFRGIGAVGYAVSRAERLVGADQARPWIAILRHGITERILAGLDGTPGAVAAALLTGERSGIIFVSFSMG